MTIYSHIPVMLKEAIDALSVNPNGTLIASSDKDGRIIKIFSADGGEPL